MELNIRELNELIYCIGIARMHGQLLGTTVADKLEDKLRIELDKRLEPDYVSPEILESLKQFNKTPITLSKNDAEVFFNEIQNPSEPNEKLKKAVKESGWITQSILDYVLSKGDATYKEMNEYYRKITGSNSFSHHLYNLIIPYKNRPTRRYLVKNGNGLYEVKVANLHNWVTIEDDVMIHRY